MITPQPNRQEILDVLEQAKAMIKKGRAMRKELRAMAKEQKSDR